MTDEPEVQARAVDRRFQWVCFVLTAVAVVVTGAASQQHDAFVYSASATYLLDGVAPPDSWGFRGALTSLVYLPAASAAKVGLPLAVGVLVQNSALIAAIGSFLLPAVLRPVVVITWQRVVAACVLVVVVLGRFAPPALMDLWSAAAMLVAIVLLARPSGRRVLVAGVLLGAAINLRPAYLLPVLLLLVAWAVWVRRHLIWLAVGSTAVVLPQVVLELFRPGSFGLWTSGLDMVNRLQLGFAGYVVRYDTAIAEPELLRPVFYCAPGLASVQRGEITTPIDLVMHLGGSLPGSLGFVAEKMTSWLLWTWTTPYYDLNEPIVSQLGVITVTLVVLGVYGWSSRVRQGDVPRSLAVTVASLALGVLAGSVTSTPEARFALPLVVLGMAGIALVRTEKVRGRHVAGVFVAVALIVAVGRQGLMHPVQGGVTSDDCAGIVSGTSAASAVESR